MFPRDNATGKVMVELRDPFTKMNLVDKVHVQDRGIDKQKKRLK